MKPIYIYMGGKWYIQISAKGNGSGLFLDKYNGVSVPVSFDSEEEMLFYIGLLSW